MTNADYPPPTPADIEAAAATIGAHVLRTPLLPAPLLSSLTGAEIWVKYENLQVTGSFKERGAVNRLAALTEAERNRGVITLSAGNHGQAVAYHARRMGVPATIVMPRTTPFTKAANTEAYGARVVLEGESVAECSGVVDTLIERHGHVLVHPYDDPLVMAGQGTVALEMLEDAPDLECLVVPVGGGGLIAGVCVAARQRKPGIRIVAVQSALYPGVRAAHENRPELCGGDTLAEGIAVKSVSRTALSVMRDSEASLVTVGDADIEAAIYAYLTRQKTLAEGAGAASLAALLADSGLCRGRRSALSCRAATSTRVFCPRSRCGRWSARTGSCACVSRCGTGRENWGAWPRSSAGKAPIFSRSRISACCSTCRRCARPPTSRSRSGTGLTPSG
jgi:threonine dehydratase